MGLITMSPDAESGNADWTKKTWDLPPFMSPEFLEIFPDVEAFKTTPAYNHAVEAGLIVDDEWVGDYIQKE